MWQSSLRWCSVVTALVVLSASSAVRAQTPAAPPPPEPGASTTPAPPASVLAMEPEDVSPLVPRWEPARMAQHAVSEHVSIGPGTGVRIATTDGDFTWTMNARLQLMSLTTWPDGGPAATSFLVRRARFLFSGNVFGPDIRYKIEFGFAPSDLRVRNNVTDPAPRASPLFDFYFDFGQLRDLTVRVGQSKVPFNREFVTSSGSLQMADLSLANNEFALDRDIGVDVRSNDLFGLGHLRYAAGVYSGRGRDSIGAIDAGLMYVGRVEVLPFGMFTDYVQGDFERTLRPRLALGFSYAFLDRAKRDRGTGGNVPTDGGTTDFHTFVADSMFKLAGFSMLGEVFYRRGQRNPGDAAPMADLARNGWGLTAQAGYLIPHLPLEIEARYSTAQGTGATSLADSSELGGGMSYYFARHSLKLQADYFRLWSAPDAASSADIRDGGHRVRVQLTAEL